MASTSSPAWHSAGPSFSSDEARALNRGCRSRSPRRGLEIAGIIVGFIVAWPLALAYLVWKMMGYPMRDRLQDRFQETLRTSFGRPFDEMFRPMGGSTGNAAFEEYRQNELRRLEEERRKLDEEARAFRDFVEELKRAKDREEFDAFMARRRGGAAGTSNA